MERTSQARLRRPSTILPANPRPGMIDVAVLLIPVLGGPWPGPLSFLVSRTTKRSTVTDNARTLANFMESVWNQGDAAAVDRFLADQYVIHSDPGDPWEGATLS